MIWFVGDTHGAFVHLLRAVKQSPPSAIVLLGDMECPGPLEVVLAPILDLTDVWFIPGNHDVDKAELWQRLTHGPLAKHNLHGRVVTIAGYRIAGLGGVFDRAVWLPPAEPAVGSYAELVAKMEPAWDTRRTEAEQAVIDNKKLKHQATIFPDIYDALAAVRADILVTHEAPSCHSHGSTAIDELAQALGVKRAFHGHHHDRQNYSAAVSRLGFQPFGVGLRGIVDLDGNVIVPGELDEERRRQ